MKKYSLMAALVVLSFIIQTSLFKFFNILGVVPNLSLILLVIFSLMTDEITGGVLGLITGLMYDTMIYDVFGVYTLIYFFLGAIIGVYSDEMLRENYVAYTAVTALSTAAMHFFLYVILFFLRYRVGNVDSILVGIIIEIVFNTVLSVFVFKIINLLFEKLNVK
ncbi:MAG: rod shape-determining protein MreD [Sedimentibacter sp.]|jgi:rod shape-determining protein MreD|nr:rod shape-determining protein MreD [Sedimentibacter sp.]